MTLQQLINLHNPRTLADADALVRGNYFHHKVDRQVLESKGLRLGYKYTVVKRKWLWVFPVKEVAYICGI